MDEIKPINIEGENYYSIQQFSFITKHSEASIKQLVNFGNKFGILKTRKFDAIGKKPLIIASELTDYVFTRTGRKDLAGLQTGYKYDSEGNMYVVKVSDNGNIEKVENK